MDERRQSMENLHQTLKEQNELLRQILEFMCPVAAFCANAKIIVKFGSWLFGLVATVVGIWQGIDFLEKHK